VVLVDGNRYTIGSELTNNDPLTIGFVPFHGKIPNHFVSLLRSITTSQLNAVDHCAESTKSTSGDGPFYVPQLASDSVSFDHEANTEQKMHTKERPGQPRPVDCACCQGELRRHSEVNVLASSGKTYGANKKKTRTVQTKWFEDFHWLSYCTARAALFCHYCRTAERQKLLTFSKNAETAFTVDGFQNWKKAISRFQQHERCDSHKEAVLKSSVVNHMPVMAQLVEQEANDQENRRLLLLKQLTSLRLLLRQGLVG